jgi:hypothetical protein
MENLTVYLKIFYQPSLGGVKKYAKTTDLLYGAMVRLQFLLNTRHVISEITISV